MFGRDLKDFVQNILWNNNVRTRILQQISILYDIILGSVALVHF